MSLRAVPKISATLSESALYGTMGRGLTDSLFLIGHADGLELNAPYQVLSVRDALDAMNSDSDSPLVRGLLEAHLSGARDVWIVATAPMSEYEELEDRDEAYEAQFLSRLKDTYDILKYWDIPDIVVPLEAQFNSGTDFLTPLVQFCVESFNLSSSITLGLLGTRGDLTESIVEVMKADARPTLYGDAGKFVAVFAGDVNFNLQEMPTNHTSSAVASLAGQITSLPYDRGVLNYPLKHPITTVGRELSKEDISELAERGINVVSRTTKGKRGNPFQVIAKTDNTLAAEGSDFWSLMQMRVTSLVANHVTSLGKRTLGTIGYSNFQTDVRDYLTRLVVTGLIRQYDVDFQRSQTDLNKVYVNLVITPFFGVRELQVDIMVGPRQG